MIYGYKIICEKYIDIKCEIAIYNNDFKETILNEVRNYNVPIYISMLLFIIKIFYYNFPIISKKTYMTYKRQIFDKYLRKKDTIFFLLKQS
jgi:hypothetical protein